MMQIEETPEQPQLMIDNTLELNDYQAFPNPTHGQFNLRFNAEPVPTRVRVIDVNGKVVHNEVINQFDGIYNNQINLSSKAAPGTLFLQKREGEIEPELHSEASLCVLHHQENHL